MFQSLVMCSSLDRNKHMVTLLPFATDQSAIHQNCHNSKLTEIVTEARANLRSQGVVILDDSNHFDEHRRSGCVRGHLTNGDLNSVRCITYQRSSLVPRNFDDRRHPPPHVVLEQRRVHLRPRVWNIRHRVGEQFTQSELQISSRPEFRTTNSLWESKKRRRSMMMVWRENPKSQICSSRRFHLQKILYSRVFLSDLPVGRFFKSRIELYFHDLYPTLRAGLHYGGDVHRSWKNGVSQLWLVENATLNRWMFTLGEENNGGELFS